MMVDKIVPNLTGVSKTLLLTLAARARESRRPEAMLKDDAAAGLVKRLDCDFSHFRLSKHDEIAVIMRTKQFDMFAREFLTQNPDGVVVHIGCGLDSRFERVDNGRVEWFDLDVPEVIELRRQLLPSSDQRYHLLGASVFGQDWLDEVNCFLPKPFLFMAEGVLPYFAEAQVKTLFCRLRVQFPGSELVCDEHTSMVAWADNLKLLITRMDARLQWSTRMGKDPEQWAEGIRLLRGWNYYEEDEPRLNAFRWVRRFPAIVNSSGIYHYRLGEKI